MDEPRKVVRRFLEDVWSRGDLDACDQFINADHVHHFGARDIRGPDGVKALVAGLRQTFPDLRVDVDDVIAEGEKVAVRMTLRETDRGGFMGQGPTSNSVSAPPEARACVRLRSWSPRVRCQWRLEVRRAGFRVEEKLVWP